MACISTGPEMRQVADGGRFRPHFDGGPDKTMPTVAEILQSRIGTSFPPSEWVTIDQPLIDAFAAATGDHQWIHVDPERAAAGPFGGTIAHGYLTLSLLPRLSGDSWAADLGLHAKLNYGLDRVRFLTPVRAGVRIRNRARLISAEPRGEGRTLVAFENTIEIEGEAKPALIAHALVLAFG
jgi:acyl dehydratase